MQTPLRAVTATYAHDRRYKITVYFHNGPTFTLQRDEARPGLLGVYSACCNEKWEIPPRDFEALCSRCKRSGRLPVVKYDGDFSADFERLMGSHWGSTDPLELTIRASELGDQLAFLAELLDRTNLDSEPHIGAYLEREVKAKFRIA